MRTTNLHYSRMKGAATMRLIIRLTAVFGAVVLAFAVIIPATANSAEARNAPSVTETVEVEFATVEGVSVTTVLVSASRQRGPDSDGEVVVRHSVTTCISVPLLLHVCYIDFHVNELNTTLEFSLRDASLVVFEQDCRLFCPLGKGSPIIELNWKGTDGVKVTREGSIKTQSRMAQVTGNVDGVSVPAAGVSGTITVTETRN